MYSYRGTDWIMLFFIYGFLGWVFESTYVSIKKRKVINRGFLKGPMLPIYAFGAILMLFVSIPFERNLIATYFAGMIAATALEFVVGILMESIFKVKYWDYSNQKFQFKGVICISSSVAWGFFTLLLTEVIHKPIEKMLFLIPDMVKYVLVVVLGIIFAADTVLSVKVALDLRQMLEKMTAMKKELEELQEQFAEYASEWKEGIKKSASEQHEKLEEQWEDIMANAPEKLAVYRKLKGKFAEYKTYSKGYGLLKAQLLKANPTASSKKHKEALKDVLEAIDEGIQAKKEDIKQKMKKKNED